MTALHIDSVHEPPAQKRWAVDCTFEWLFCLCLFLFSPHLHPDALRRKCSNGSVFPREPSRADDPLWQVGEQEGHWLFVHLQRRTGCAAAWGSGFSCQGEQNNYFLSILQYCDEVRKILPTKCIVCYCWLWLCFENMAAKWFRPFRFRNGLLAGLLFGWHFCLNCDHFG